MPLAVTVLLALWGYLANERSKRAAFRREKEWDRKFDAFQKSLASLIQLREIGRIIPLLNAESGLIQGVLSNQPKEKGKRLIPQLNLMGVLLTPLVLGGKPEYFDMIEKLPPDRKEFEQAIEELAQKAFADIMMKLVSLERDFEQAFAGLTLLKVDSDILVKLKGVDDSLAMGLAGFQSETFDDGKFSQSITDIQSLMNKDLDATIETSGWFKRFKKWLKSKKP